MAWKVIIPLVERMLSSAGEVTFHLRKENRLLQEWGARRVVCSFSHLQLYCQYFSTKHSSSQQCVLSFTYCRLLILLCEEG